jgi:hypothetical protein
MESEGNSPILINQFAIKRRIPEEQQEAFREGQRRRGFRLVADLAPEENSRVREVSPVLQETQPDPEGWATPPEEFCEEEATEARKLIDRVRSADPNSEEFWEGRIALFFGRDLEGHPLPKSERESVHATGGKTGKEGQVQLDERTLNFWEDHP